MSRARWTDDMLSQFARLCADQHPRDVIADHLGLTVRQVANLHNWLRQTDSFPHDLPEKIRINRSCFHALCDELRALSAAGLGSGAIADRIGASRAAVASFMSYHGLFHWSRRKGAKRYRQTVSLAGHYRSEAA
jgi:hypothetical protein